MEPLSGTVVQVGCCRKQVHIQCYVSKCPFCRAELPFPVVPPPQHVIVPVPVAVERTKSWKVFVTNMIVICIVAGICVYSIER